MFVDIKEINFTNIIETLVNHGKAFVNDFSNDAFDILESMAETENKTLLMIEQDDHKHQVAIYMTNESTHRWVFYNGAV